MSDAIELLKLQQRFNLFLITAALLGVAFGFAWLAVIDAPVTGIAIILMAAATLLTVTVVIAATAARQCALEQALAHSEGLAQRQRRANRLTGLCLVLAVLLTALACCLTLALKQVGTEDEQTEATMFTI